MTRTIAALCAAIALSSSLLGCAAITQQAADPKVVSGITTACTDSGLFKLVDGAVTMALPAATLPVAVINAGVDKVCADPARFASDISTIEWVAKNLAGAAKKAAG
jgi:hypothetical protein